jgi:hypothetical protein
MHELAEFAIQAHGGLVRWKSFRTVSADLIQGGTPGAHYVDDFVDVSGILFPTKRRIFPRQPDGRSLSEPLVVSIDLRNILLS